MEPFFAWGDGKVTIDTVTQITIGGGARLVAAKKAFTVDARMNDQAYLVVEDGAKSVLVGDVIYDEERAKKPSPVRGDADLDGLRLRLKQYLIGAFSLVLDPAGDRKGWKGVTVKADTGYGNYPTTDRSSCSAAGGTGHAPSPSSGGSSSRWPGRPPPVPPTRA